MLIRSQDKEKIIILQNVGSISIRIISENGYAIDAIFTGKTGETIAHYFSKEKAIKVLDMIQVTYMNLDYSRFLGNEKIEYYENVFVMPQDEEVKA